MFFSDLENFSTHAEQMAPNELLDQMSTYFEQVSRAISEEHGTVDKFIGDGIMAFWGAPVPATDHVLRACCRRVAGGATDGAGQCGLERGGPAAHSDAHRVELRATCSSAMSDRPSGSAIR